MIRVRCPWAACAAVLLSLCFVGGCGVSDPAELPPAFQFVAIGPNGGAVSTTSVDLVIPAGALSADTAVAILPQALEFPVAQVEDDPCRYDYLGELWCIGPVGTPLLIDGFVRLSYNPGLVPFGFTLADLVLLEWDEGLQALVPNLDAVHNTTEFFFEDAFYGELGHIAIGLRTCPPGGIVFSAVELDEGEIDNEFASVAPATTTGLYVQNVDLGPGTTKYVDTGIVEIFPPEEFVYSPDTAKILFIDTDEEDYLVKTVQPDPAAPAVTVAGPPFLVEPFDPFAGWLHEGGGKDVFFRHFLPGNLAQPASGGGLDLVALSRRAGSGLSPAVQVYTDSASDAELIDMRQSDDGKYALLLFDVFGGALQGSGQPFVSGNHIVIIDVHTKAVLSSGAIPVGGGLFTPRFMPTSPHVYTVSDDRTQVIRYNLNGSNPTAIWTPPLSASRRILEAIVLPDGLHVAAIATDSKAIDPTGLNRDFVLLGLLGGGILQQDIQQNNLFTYHEVAMHAAGETPFNPGFPTFYVEREDNKFGRQVVPYSLSPGGIFRWFPLVAQRLEHVDFNREDGRLLQLVDQSALNALAVPSTTSLQSVLDDRLEFDTVTAATDNTNDELFAMAAASSTAAFLIEITSVPNLIAFGIYEAGDADNRVTIFTGPESAPIQRKIGIKPNGDVVQIHPDLSETLLGTGFDDGTFGFFTTRQGPLLRFSERSRNAGDVQVLSFRGDGTDNIDLDDDAVFETLFGVNDFVFAWDDNPPSATKPDYQDFVVYVSGLVPLANSLTTNLFVTDPTGEGRFVPTRPVILPIGTTATHARWRHSVRTTPGMSSSPPRVR